MRTLHNHRISPSISNRPPPWRRVAPAPRPATAGASRQNSTFLPSPASRSAWSANARHSICPLPLPFPPLRAFASQTLYLPSALSRLVTPPPAQLLDFPHLVRIAFFFGMDIFTSAPASRPKRVNRKSKIVNAPQPLDFPHLKPTLFAFFIFHFEFGPPWCLRVLVVHPVRPSAAHTSVIVPKARRP